MGASGDAPDKESAYEPYLGRWSRLVADEFVAWLAVPARQVWLDAACGTGALTRAILAAGEPLRVDACDLASARIEYASRNIGDSRAALLVADACELERPAGTYGAAVSGLPFPSIDQPARLLSNLAGIAAGGVVGLYVWDLYGQMEVLRYFWDAATTLNASADEADDGDNFAVCRPEYLASALHAAGWLAAEVRPIDVAARFRDFDDYWMPFTRGNAPAQTYVQSLSEERRSELRDFLRAALPLAPDGSLTLNVRAWAAKGRAPLA